jgi:hypothetical protein
MGKNQAKLNSLFLLPVIFILFSMLACTHSPDIWVTAKPTTTHKSTMTPTPKACIYSTDDTYGYIKNNPIRIGGGDMGVLRIRAFLDRLYSRNGEKIGYIHRDIIEFEGTGEDIYDITLSDRVISTLYFSVFTFEEPKIPRGFTCTRVSPYSISYRNEISGLKNESIY